MTVQAQIVSLLRELQQRHQLGYLFISHDLAVVRALSDYVIVMREGTVVEQDKPRKFSSGPKVLIHVNSSSLWEALTLSFREPLLPTIQHPIRTTGAKVRKKRARWRKSKIWTLITQTEALK